MSIGSELEKYIKENYDVSDGQSRAVTDAVEAYLYEYVIPDMIAEAGIGELEDEDKGTD